MPKAVTPVAGLRLRLYVVGSAPNSVRAIRNATALCAEHFAGTHELEIVNLLEHPQRALGDAIIVTPTLIKLHPLPEQRIVGNLDDAARVLMVLTGQ